MSNRVKARLTVAAVLLVIIAWQVASGRLRESRFAPFPPLLVEQIAEERGPNVVDCDAAVRRMHTERLREPEDTTSVVLDEAEAARLVQSVAAAYYQRDIDTEARLSAPQLFEGAFFGQRRLAWGQLWQPPGFDGSFDETEAVVIYVDAVAAVPLMVYTDVEVMAGATNCLPPPVARTRQVWLQWALPIMAVFALGLIAYGAAGDRRDTVADSPPNLYDDDKITSDASPEQREMPS